MSTGAGEDHVVQGGGEGSAPEGAAERDEDDVKLDRGLRARLATLGGKKVSSSETPAQRQRRALADQAVQDKQWRSIVFYGVLGLISVGFLVSIAIMARYFFADPENAEPVVIASWFGASVVQTIGLLAIITRSLFPNRSDPPRVDE